MTTIKEIQNAIHRFNIEYVETGIADEKGVHTCCLGLVENDEAGPFMTVLVEPGSISKNQIEEFKMELVQKYQIRVNVVEAEKRS